MGDDTKQPPDEDAPSAVEAELVEEDANEERVSFTAPIEDLPRGTTVAGHVILGRVAEGGAGVVYAAFDPDLDRKVAIKLLYANESDEDGAQASREHLLRQAQESTKISHPAVAQVHDVGTFDGGIFIAMEYIDGIDLRAWMEARDDPFPWTEVLRVFREAGRGLAAAHAAGVVHRDFKPSNVLLGKGGRICVLDFGLAYQVLDEDDSRDLSISELREAMPGSLASIDESIPELTDGARFGTPGYMAPEQHVGGVADKKSDQFAFCVAFYEALYGERPFKGTRRSTIALEAINNRIRDAPDGSDVPDWLRETLLKGLSPRRSARYASMEALLRALDYDPRASRRRWVAGLGALALLGAGAGAVSYLLYAEDQRCEPDEALLAGVWDPGTQRQISDAFVATADPHAEETWHSVKGTVDEWVQEWLDFRALACRATRVRGEASEELLSKRYTCLDKRLGKVAAFTRVYATPTRPTLHRAQQVATSIPLPRWCVQEISLQASAPPPASRTDQVEELREEHNDAWIAWQSGQLNYARARAEQVYDELKEIDYPPLRISTLTLLGALDRDAGDHASARRRLHAAAAEASAAGLQLYVAQAWLELVITLSREPNPPSNADVWTDYAVAVVDRTGDELMQAELFAARAEIARASGRAADALSLYHRAMATFREDMPGTGLRLGQLEARLGSMVAERKEWASAVSYLERSLEHLRAQLGPEHPELIGPMRQLAQIGHARGKPEDAIAMLDRALSIESAAHGAQTTAAADLHVELGRLEQERGRKSAANEHYLAAASVMDQVTKGGAADARTRDLLARALWGIAEERSRARRLIDQAREGYGAAGDRRSLSHLDDWVEEQRAAEEAKPK